MDLVIILIICAGMGWLGYVMAESRNRNQALWAALGFFFGLIAIIVLALIGTKKETT